jgi:hypothetical protein
MKRLLEERDASFAALTELLASAERHVPSPFTKRAVQSRVERALASPPRARLLRSALVGAGALLLALSAAASYSLLGGASAPPTPQGLTPPSALAPPPVQRAPAVVSEIPPAEPQQPPAEPQQPPAEPPAPVVKRAAEKPLAGEDPTQVAEAVRALRKQGDAARAQALLDQYLRGNPRGALAEDALALSIEAAASRKDPRAADYARRYLARYPNGRFRAVAERALVRSAQ